MFSFDVTTAANVTKASPTRTSMQLIRGLIDLVEVAFPPGSQGLLHVVIERGGAPLWPNNVGEGYTWDDYTLRFSPLYELAAAPLALYAITWNEDDAFSHRVTLRFNIVPVEVYFPPRPELGILQRLDRLLGRRR